MRILTCRKCHKQFEAKEEDKDIKWIERSKNYYYHIDCWNEFIDIYRDKNSAEWLDLIYDLFSRELHEEYDYFKIQAQAKKFVENNVATMKGIYYSLYWFYVIKKNKYSKDYGIGIIPYIYNDSTKYWIEQEEKRNGIMQEILRIEQIEKSSNKQKVKIKNKKTQTITKEPIILE